MKIIPIISSTKTRLIVGVFLLCYLGCTFVYELHRNVMIQLSVDNGNSNEYNLDEPEIVHVNNNVLSTRTEQEKKKKKQLVANTMTTTTTTKTKKEKDMKGEPTQKKKKNKKIIVAAEAPGEAAAISVAALSNSDSSNNDSFSACILWMDDNYRLEEWLAYHYYIMKLRYVVMAVDQFSRTSPQHIVDRWNDKHKKYPHLNMTIVTWTDSEYITNYAKHMKTLQHSMKVDSAVKQGRKKTKYYLYRQPEFYRLCSKHLVQQNKSWTSYHDIDEFITLKHHTVHKEGIQKTKQPGFILNALNSIKEKAPLNAMTCVNVNRKRYCSNELHDDETNELLSESSKSENNGIIPHNLFMEEEEKSINTTNSNNNTNEETQQQQQQQVYNNTIQRFDTLRYKYITPRFDGKAKSFIDLSQPNPQLYIQNQYRNSTKTRQWASHLPMVELCKYERKHLRDQSVKDLLSNENFIINHYLGSWESYSFRDDARMGGIRTYQTWLERSNHTKGEYSHVIRPWLQGFTKLVGGAKVASYLLQDAGKLSYPQHQNATTRKNDYTHTYKYGTKVGDDQSRDKYRITKGIKRTFIHK